MNEFSAGDKLVYKNEVWEVAVVGRRSIKIKRIADKTFNKVNSYSLTTIYQRDSNKIHKIDKLLIHKIISDAKSYVTELLKFMPHNEMKDTLK